MLGIMTEAKVAGVGSGESDWSGCSFQVTLALGLATLFTRTNGEVIEEWRAQRLEQDRQLAGGCSTSWRTRHHLCYFSTCYAIMGFYVLATYFWDNNTTVLRRSRLVAIIDICHKIQVHYSHYMFQKVLTELNCFGDNT